MGWGVVIVAVAIGKCLLEQGASDPRASTDASTGHAPPSPMGPWHRASGEPEGPIDEQVAEYPQRGERHEQREGGQPLPAIARQQRRQQDPDEDAHPSRGCHLGHPPERERSLRDIHGTEERRGRDPLATWTVAPCPSGGTEHRAACKRDDTPDHETRG